MPEPVARWSAAWYAFEANVTQSSPESGGARPTSLWRRWGVAAAAALTVATLSVHPAFDRLDGASIDTLFWLRDQAFAGSTGANSTPLSQGGDSPTVVIAIDEETYRRPPFNGLPKALWTPQLAQIIERVLDAGATVIGQDIILPTSAERFIKGYDRSYLLALRQGARDGRMVLGKVQHLAKPLSPFAGYSFAVGHGKNIRLVNLIRDGDGVIRRVPLTFEKVAGDGSTSKEASFVLEVAARARGITPVLAEDGTIVFDGRRIHGGRNNELLLNFATGDGGIPVYSLADLLACDEGGGTAFFTKAFAGKAVILGAALDVEDRKLTSTRLARAPDRAWFAPRCAWPVMAELYPSDVVRQSLPGTLILATAVNNILRANPLREPPQGSAFAITLLFAVIATFLAMGRRTLPCLTGLILVLLAWLIMATVLFRDALSLPLFDPIVAATAVFAFILGYRFTVTDREKRHIRRAFSYYLPGPVIERMERSGATPVLGGEIRDLTVFFSDIADFTKLCEGLDPGEVVRLMNRYLDTMTQVIETRGGFVDKYIGDAVVAVFGAPLADPDHALHAVEAALDCQAAIAELTPQLGLPQDRHLATRIGINSGSALIGNIGSKRRFNYTVMGDTVNLAARIEGTNKRYGTGVLISDATAQRLGETIARRPLERVRVIGREEPVLLWEPIAQGHAWNQEAFLRAFEALEEGRYAAAAEHYQDLADNDRTAAVMAARATDLTADPPVEAGPPVYQLDQK